MAVAGAGWQQVVPLGEEWAVGALAGERMREFAR